MVTIIIVVYKSDPNKLKKLLNKIGKKYKIVIIDNSFDYNFKKINLNKNIKIIRSENIGNGAGINLGIKEARTPYALYFDIDVDFNKSLIKKLYSEAKKIKNFAILCPNTGKFNSRYKIIENYHFEAPVMFFNIKNLTKVGLFDKKIFLYFEEIDLFYRCKKNKKKIFILQNIKIKHSRSSSIISKKKYNNKLLYLRQWHYMWSMFYYYKKNFNYFYGIKKTIFFLIFDFLKLVFFLIKLNKKNFLIRFNRIQGLIASYLFFKSYKRIE